MNKSFTLSFHEDEPPSRLYPTGYWVAATSDGNYDGVGATPEAAMASLINVLVKALKENTF